MKTFLTILAGCACFVTQVAASVVTGRVGSLPDGGDTLDVVLKEQPILLEETLVTKTKPAKKMTRRQKNPCLRMSGPKWSGISLMNTCVTG